MEGIGQDLYQPYQPSLDILEEEQLHSAIDERAYADEEPNLGNVPNKLAWSGMRRQNAEQRRVDVKGKRRQCPDRQQHNLAPQVIADLDLFLIFVRGLVHHVVIL